MQRIFINIGNFLSPSYYRCYLPFAHCHRELLEEGIELTLSDKLYGFSDYDCLILSGYPNPNYMQNLRELKERGIKLVWQTDDLLTHCEPDNPVWESVGQRDVENFVECLDLADKILVSTPYLKKALKHPKKTFVCPNLIEMSAFPEPTYDEDYINVLWAGGNAHGQDLVQLVQPIKQLSKLLPQVRFSFMGMIPHGLPDGVRFRCGVPIDQFIPTAASLQPNIGLAPLVDNEFNRSKSNIKFLEYSCLGAATIASPLEPYKMLGGDCLLTKDWVASIVKLVKDNDQRLYLTKQARESVKAVWSWDSYKKSIWLNFFRGLAG